MRGTLQSDAYQPCSRRIPSHTNDLDDDVLRLTTDWSTRYYLRLFPVTVGCKLKILGMLQGVTEQIEEAVAGRPPRFVPQTAVRPGLEAVRSLLRGRR